LAVVARISYRMLGDERPYGVNRQIHACYNDCNDYGGGGSGEGSGSVRVEVLRARLTRRDVEDLDLISEISPIRQALGWNRKIQLDVHGYPTGSGYPSTAITGYSIYHDDANFGAAYGLSLSGEFVSFEDEFSLSQKLNYSIGTGLSGAFEGFCVSS
jgi:hypothetical protein